MHLTSIKSEILSADFFSMFMKLIQYVILFCFVEAIWGKEENSVFHEHKELLLQYLERLGFIAKPIQDSKSDEV